MPNHFYILLTVFIYSGVTAVALGLMYLLNRLGKRNKPGQYHKPDDSEKWFIGS